MKQTNQQSGEICEKGLIEIAFNQGLQTTSKTNTYTQDFSPKLKSN